MRQLPNCPARKAITEIDRKRRPCAACRAMVGTATILCGGEFPDACLCLDCGTRRDLAEVVAMIRKRRAEDSR